MILAGFENRRLKYEIKKKTYLCKINKKKKAF